MPLIEPEAEVELFCELELYAPLVEAGAVLAEAVVVSLYTDVPVVVAVVVSVAVRVEWLQPLRTRPRAIGNRIDLFIGGM